MTQKVQFDGRKIALWLLIFLALLIGTNVANYLIFGGREEPAALEEEEKTVIRYEPGKETVESELAIIWEAIDTIEDNYFHEVEIEKLVEGAVRGVIDSVDDPQVRFYDPVELDEFLTDTRGSYGGIGVRIIESNRHIVVFEVFPKTPAERSGLSPGDRIIEAGGSALTGEGLERAVELLRGPPDTAVDIKIKRPGADEPLELVVEREEIKVQTVFTEMLDRGLGYIKISNFDSRTAAEFLDKFALMEQEGLGKGLILDLRNNPGGLVEQAVKVAEQLVPEGEIVKLVGRDEEVQQVYYSNASPKHYPIVVLINEESASSAELLAGALQDRGAALLVGQKTFGKASVQQLERLSGGNAILLTVANYYTPAGINIDEHGIKPDFKVEMPDALRYYRYFHPGTLEQGDYGPDVEMLQQMLEQIGYRIEVTGYFDSQTSRVLADFQTDSGLERSGNFDDLTWVELREALDVASHDKDEQLNYALELIEKPNLWNIIGGND